MQESFANGIRVGFRLIQRLLSGFCGVRSSFKSRARQLARNNADICAPESTPPSASAQIHFRRRVRAIWHRWVSVWWWKRETGLLLWRREWKVSRPATLINRQLNVFMCWACGSSGWTMREVSGNRWRCLVPINRIHWLPARQRFQRYPACCIRPVRELPGI